MPQIALLICNLSFQFLYFHKQILLVNQIAAADSDHIRVVALAIDV